MVHANRCRLQRMGVELNRPMRAGGCPHSVAAGGGSDVPIFRGVIKYDAQELIVVLGTTCQSIKSKLRLLLELGERTGKRNRAFGQ